MTAEATPERLVAVLDMGATAIRLVIAQIRPDGGVRTIEEASRGVLLGRDAFASNSIGPETAEQALAALEGFREMMDGYGVAEVRAVATSAVREARNRDTFLDRVRNRTGIAFDIINEAEESRLVFLALRSALARHAVFRGAWTLLAEVGGGSTSLTLLHRGQPHRSAVYALGAVRLRQQLQLARHAHDLQVALLKRNVANVIDEIRPDIPLRRITQFVAGGGDIRFAASQLLDQEPEAGRVRELSRDEFLGFCDTIERLDEDAIAERFRLPAVDADTLMPALLIYRMLLAETSARRVVVSDASLRAGVLMDLAGPGGPQSVEDFERQVLASAETLGYKYRFDREHGRHVAMLATRLFDQLRVEHALGSRERLLLQVAALLHDIGIFVSLRAHHKHAQYLIAASQIFGLSDDETALVSNVARYHRRGMPQRSHLPFVALDRPDRLIVNKLAALLRIANALDAEHLQKIEDVRVRPEGRSWTLELHGRGDLVMEELATAARADMFAEIFGHQLVIRPVVVQQ